MSAAHPFATQWQYAVSMYNSFIQGLDCTLMPQFWKNYPQHSSAHNLSGAYQRRVLPVILAAVQAAKDKCQQIQDISRKIITSQGFFMQGTPGAKAYPSQAEQPSLSTRKVRISRSKLNCTAGVAAAISPGCTAVLSHAPAALSPKFLQKLRKIMKSGWGK